MEIVTRTIQSGAVIDVQGEVDMSTSPELRKVLVGLVEKKTPRILVNLGEVEYIDSSGLATIVECLQGVTRYGGRLRLFGISDGIIDVFRLARLDAIFDIRPDEAAALAD